MHCDLLIFGASARAAAFSALRAGFRPWCADLFADVDLQARCTVQPVGPGRYPHGFRDAAQQAPLVPWLYTGGLENRPALVRAIARIRPLWGNDAEALTLARAPQTVAGMLEAAGLPFPRVLRPEDIPPQGRWLSKPLAGAGGSGIHFSTRNRSAAEQRSRHYLQEYIDGEACAALYLANGETAQLLGVTRQLVGADWLHAAPFRYCGSIGPLPLEPDQVQAFERLGAVLATGCRLRGLFGVDAVLREGSPWPIEINPRYTASVEVLEHATGQAALARHGRVFDPGIQQQSPPAGPRPTVAGKAILYARSALAFPAAGPWSATLAEPFDPWQLPRFADIPPPGQQIAAGRPILTFFAQADDSATCLEQLQHIAAGLTQLFWPPGKPSS